MVLHLHHFLRLFRWNGSDWDGTADGSCVHFACADSTPNFIGHLASVDCCFSLHRTVSVSGVNWRNVSCGSFVRGSFAMIVPASSCRIPLRRLAILSELWVSALPRWLRACTSRGCPSLPYSGSSMDCSTCAGVTVRWRARPSFNTLVQAAARSSHLDRGVMGMVRRYHRYGRCLPRSLLQVALSLCSRSDSLLPSSRSLLPLITWDAGRHCFAAVCRASFSRSWGVHHIAMVPTLDFVFLSPPPSLLCGVGRGAFLVVPAASVAGGGVKLAGRAALWLPIPHRTR